MINARELQIGNHIVSNGINYTVLGIIQNVGMPTVINVCDEHNRILDLNEEECEPKSIDMQNVSNIHEYFRKVELCLKLKHRV